MSKGLKIGVEDAKGSTPIHWACYSGKENSVNSLVAWGAELNRQDKIYGLTPLHLAVLSGNGKNVKKLLIRGADRNIRVRCKFMKDFRGKLPLDLAR
jgi:ankyrin repeat protein